MPESSTTDISVPLVVDMDGTLLRSDSLVELILELARRHPLKLFMLPFWALQSRAACKKKLTTYATLDVQTLPYNSQFLSFLRNERARGRKLILATGADEAVARAVAAHLGIFDDVIASDGTHNYSGEPKREELTRRYGANGYDYAGNSRVDLHVWRDAHGAVLVACSPIVAHRASDVARIEKIFPSEHSPEAISQAMRLGRFLLNLLVFAPLLSKTHSHRLLPMVIAFCSFCLLSSSVYLLDDLLNLKVDRRDEARKYRPFADGRASLMPAIAIAIALFAAAFAVATFLPLKFTGLLGIYFVMALGYALFLRGVPVLGFLAQISLLVLRIIGGYWAF
jgi:phosphoserine phosphatase